MLCTYQPRSTLSAKVEGAKINVRKSDVNARPLGHVSPDPIIRPRFYTEENRYIEKIRNDVEEGRVSMACGWVRDIFLTF